MIKPSITYDPISWLVMADYLEERGIDNLYVRQLRFRAEVAKAMQFTENHLGHWVPCLLGMCRPLSCGWRVSVVVRPNTILVEIRESVADEPMRTEVWMRKSVAPNRYCKNRVWQLADWMLFQSSGIAEELRDAVAENIRLYAREARL